MKTIADPDSPPADLNAPLRQALDWIRAGRFADARALLEPLAARPGIRPGEHPDERLNLLLAYALGGSHEPVRAAALFCALALRYPAAVHPAYDLVTLLVAQNRRADAEPVLQEVVARTPHDGRAHESLGDLLIQLGRFRDAEARLRTAIDLRPDSLSAQNLMAACLSEQGRNAEADAIFRRVLAAHPDDATTHANRGHLLAAENTFDAALDHFRQAIALRPDDARVRLNHSIALLKAGRYAEGWTEHEWRFRLPGHASVSAATLMPSLTPDLDIAGTHILLTHEEGLGDTLMYLRYLPPLVRRGARLTVRVPETLAPLVRRIAGLHRVITGDQPAPAPVPAYDWHCPLISLPRVFAATAEAMGDPPPYLTASPELVRHWRPYLPSNGRLNVGVVWAGSSRPDVTKAYMTDRRRSMKLAALAPLGRVAGINLVSLQKGPATAQMADLPDDMRLYDPMEDVRDMDDTAALVASLDVVVSVDTSIVHLAGALGRPVIMLDRYDNCWRWLSGREDSPWYPTLRIIRQPRPHAWDDVVAGTAAILEQMAAGMPERLFQKS
ncbi:tetratricopeptide repeat protein [Gluconacetobacter diazotrophicus]|uniref:tetratricopeptide repeat protein n=1 Tax=Gluconacetobacter diazotrophicus TaxID=33996 RepID=UPI000173C81D|nr:tetratricopeptide repeat protein [Gluconacetobacter diazotrophicus]TWB10276.1 Flp pilus assembly protein TadD [Gluconacetobacter diazotrophicus]